MYDLLGVLKPGYRLNLEQLAAVQELQSPQFVTVEFIPGGMGYCVRVRHSESGREYALKTVRLEGLEEDILYKYKRFTEEAKIWITLATTGGVVPAYCVERINEIPAVCAKWMERGSLGRFLSFKSPKFFYATLDRIVRTLRWAWEHYAVVHRDLKPDNILFGVNDWPYISDWGIARSVVEQCALGTNESTQVKFPASRRLTAPGSFLGTLLYASPEQIMDAASADLRSDIYSLGCIMFEWEKGTPPFFDGSPKEIAYAHLNRKPGSLSGWFSPSDFGADPVIMKCLEKRRENRFQSYEDLETALKEASRRQKVIWHPLPIAQSQPMPRVGGGQFTEFLKGDTSAVWSNDAKFGVIEEEKLEPYYKEADVLMGLGEWQKATTILGSLFAPEMIRAFSNCEYYQAIVTNYGLCLGKLGRTSEAIEVFRTLSGCEKKPAQFYVNFAYVLNLAGNFRESEAVAKKGLLSFPDDKDILGNLTGALIGQGNFREAAGVAQKHLTISRDVHSLEEMAAVLSHLASERRDDNWPQAFELYKQVKDLLVEAKNQNPLYETVRCSLAQAWFDLEHYARVAEELRECQGQHLPLHSTLRQKCAGLTAQCLLWTGQFSECVSFADRCLEKFPGDFLLLRPRAEALVDGFVIGRMKEGVRIVERSSLEFFEQIVQDSQHRLPSDFCFLARLKYWMGYTKEALNLLERAEQIFSSYWAISFQHGNILQMEGHPDAAFEFALAAARKGAWQAPAWQLVSRVASALGKEAAAVEAEQKASQVNEVREQLRKSL